MKKYWAENQQVQKWGLLIIKTLVLVSFGIVICEIARETIGDFIAIFRNPSLLATYCTPDCNVSWMMGLFGLLCVYEIGLSICLLKCPRGFWLTFLLVFWGLIGLMYLEDAWQYSWQPKAYTWTFIEGINYVQYIGKNLIFWMWAALGVLQVFLPVRVRKYVISFHTGIVGLLLCVGGIMALISGKI